MMQIPAHLRARYGGVSALLIIYVLALFNAAWLDGLMLAPGDAAIAYVPALLRGWHPWESLVLGGYPAFADPQYMMWYPLAWLPVSYNALVVAAYVVGGLGMFAFARSIVGASLPATFAAVGFAGCGFMVAHLGHLTIIHAAAWIPWALLGVRRLALQRCRNGVIVTAVSLALCFLGGHPQIFVYGFVLVAVYGAYLVTCDSFDRRAPAWRSLAALLCALTLWFILAAVQAIPLLEMRALTVRSAWTIDDFNSYSLPFAQLIGGFFPGGFGGVPPSQTYRGAPNLTELVFYSGICVAGIAMLVPIRGVYRREVAFWVVAAVVALLYMLGTRTPLGEIAFATPLLGSFRAPARAGLVLTIALLMLASISLTTAVRSGIAWGRAFCAATLLSVMFAISLFVMLRASGGMSDVDGATLAGTTNLIFEPLALLFATCAALFALSRWRSSRVTLVCIAILSLDLATYAVRAEWRYISPARDYLRPTELSLKLRDEAIVSGGRILNLGQQPDPSPWSASANLAFGLPNAGGYGPLLLRSYSEATGVLPHGEFADIGRLDWLASILGIRWIVGGKPTVSLGELCWTEAPRFEAEFVPETEPSTETTIEIVSHTGCSVGVADGELVATVDFESRAGNLVGSAQILAGRDTSEWAYERPDVNATVRHRRAEVVDQFEVEGYRGNWYVTRMQMPAGTSALRLSVPSRKSPMLLNVRSIAGVGGTADFYRVPAMRSAGQSWARQVDESGKTVFEVRPFPAEVRLVSDAVRLAQSDILQTLKTGQLPDGRRFNPSTTALVDLSAEIDTRPDRNGGGAVSVVQRANGYWKLSIDGGEHGVLVFVSQVHYRGWRALVDGVEVPIHAANGAFQAVSVPPGKSLLELSFRSSTLLSGAALSLIGWFFVAALCVRGLRSARGRSSGSVRESVQ